MTPSETHKEPIDPPETIHVESRTVACDGGEGPLGHPRVYLRIGADNQVECNYCDRLFILKEDAAEKAGH